MDDFDPEAAALAVTDGLRPLGTPQRAAQEKRYLKSDLDFLGVAVPDMRRVVKAAVRGHPGLDAQGMVAWAVALWREPVHERRAAAVEILTLAAPRLAASDLGVLERLLRDSRTWAYVDGLAGNVAGEIALRDPTGAWPRIDAWAVDEDFWVRRSALLSLLRGVRAGTPDLARFSRYAGADGGGEGVLHPQGDRVGAAGDLTARPSLGGEMDRRPYIGNIWRRSSGGGPAPPRRRGGTAQPSPLAPGSAFAKSGIPANAGAACVRLTANRTN